MGSGKFTPQAPGKGCPDSNSVPSYDVPIASLSRQIVSAENEKEKKLFEIRLQQELMVCTYLCTYVHFLFNIEYMHVIYMCTYCICFIYAT